jgi:hypothetical protein
VHPRSRVCGVEEWLLGVEGVVAPLWGSEECFWVLSCLCGVRLSPLCLWGVVLFSFGDTLLFVVWVSVRWFDDRKS